MDDGKEDFSTQFLYQTPEMLQSFDEYLRTTRTCTHTHTCNPPGPTAANHTHTCYHTHTQLLAAGEEETVGGGDEGQKKPRKPLGNREAVRKYREKKKARAAFLEEEVKELRFVNQQLVRRLQGQAALEAEVVRLRCLLVDLKGKIDAELGCFPLQRLCDSAGLQCDSSNLRCIDGKPEAIDWEGGCMPAIMDCQTSQHGDIMSQNLDIAKAVNSMDVLGSLVSSSPPAQ